jgi:hypothetical protein
VRRRGRRSGPGRLPTQGRQPDGVFLVEQQAYFEVDDDDRINWLRIMCSGFRAISGEAAEA